MIRINFPSPKLEARFLLLLVPRYQFIFRPDCYFRLQQVLLEDLAHGL